MLRAGAASASRARSVSMSSKAAARTITRGNHTYTADPSKPPMLRYQASLPSLPIPQLSSTISKYLESVKPLITEAQFQHTKTTAEEFLKSPIASELQKRLEQRAQEKGDNWLSEWWNDAAYMGYRDPVVVFVSYFFVHIQDRARTTGPSRAAALIKAMLPFREMVESGQLEPEKVRGAPLCMESYKWLFHASRYPTKPSDTAEKFDPKENNHVVVMRKNKFFVVPLAHPETGKELSAAELEVQFQRVIDQAGPTASSTPVGVLTSDNRDKWTEAREALLALPGNAELAKKIESAMIVVCLDDTKPVTREDISWGMWTGDGKNRWYDKHQVIVYDNGRSGFLGEHSCMDGTPTLRMNEFILATLAHGKADLGPAGTPSTGKDLPAPTELKFNVDSNVASLIKGAEQRFDELIGQHQLDVLHYEGYGKNLMKKHKVSPDAWAQLVKQLAFHKMNGRPGVTYESCQTRKFKKGRTEVIRSASNESGEWARAMLENGPMKDPVKLRGLFQKAAARHIQYAAWAADAQGVDRHLFGLKKSLKEGEEVPALYNDPTFSQSNHWELSTSQLSSPYFDGWGYGEVVPDGYGLAYAIGDDYVRWTITSLREGKYESGEKIKSTGELKHWLAEAATEVREMMEAARKVDEKAAKEKEGAEKAKL